MQLTIYRGTHEIGGNCVEVCAGDTRIVIDVGLPMVGPDREPFDSSVLKGKNSSQLLDEGILPRVPGLFDAGPAPDGILLSHAHIDHAGLLTYARPEIPLYMSQGTSKMLLAGSIFANMPRVARERTRIMPPGKPVTIRDITVTAHPVDHSVFDSMAFLVEGDGKRILYSGDLRLHGRKPGMAPKMVAAVTKAPLDAMLLEGTHCSASTERQITEQELEEDIVGQVNRAPGLVMAAFSPMHLDRLVTFYRSALRTERVFVVDPYGAFVMHLAAGQCKIPRPVASAGIRVFYDTYFTNSYAKRRITKIFKLFQSDRITLDEIVDEPERHIMLFRPRMTTSEFHGRLPSHAQCLYSYWSGYLEKPEWFDARLRFLAVGGDFVEAHTSGHASWEDLAGLVREIQPKRLIPIHTFEPGAFQCLSANTTLLEDGEPFTVP